MSATPAELHVETWPIARPKPYPGNPRLNDAAVDAVAKSIREFGWRSPIVVDEHDVILAGHTRLKAAQKLGLTEVPVHVARGLSDEQAKAFRIADNQTASIAEWNDERLVEELLALKASDYDLSLLGFSEDALLKILGTGKELSGELDEVPEVPEIPITKPGDLWILGDHRLLCGDSTKPEDVSRLLDGAKPFLMVTDPPYGVEYDPEWRDNAGLNKECQNRALGKVSNDDRASWKEAWDLFPGMVAYVWHGALHSTTVALDLIASKFDLRAQIIWVKPSLVISRGAYHWRHEPCWYGARGTAKWTGDRKQSTAWDIPNMHRTAGNVDDGKTIHSTQKPVECMARPIRNHGGKEDAVYDPFLGSGTTLIACEQIGRRCFGLEIDPKYCDVIVKRWENVTGQKASLLECSKPTENTNAGPQAQADQTQRTGRKSRKKAAE
jgi:DNA modification methylase